MSFWTGSSKIHELYTAACGLYVCWLSVRGVTVLLAWMPQGRTVIVRKVQEWSLMVSISEQRRVVPSSDDFHGCAPKADSEPASDLATVLSVYDIKATNAANIYWDKEKNTESQVFRYHKCINLCILHIY